LDALLNTISNPVLFKDVNGIYQRCNQAFAQKILGTVPEEVAGKSSEIVIKNAVDLSKSDLEELDRKLIEGGPDQSFEVSIEGPDGLVLDYEVSRSVYRGEEGKPIGIVGVLQDITQRRLAMKNLESEKLAFRIIAEAAVHSEEVTVLCETVLESLLEVLDFDFGTIRIVNHESQTLDLVAVSGIKSRIGRKLVESFSLSDEKSLSVYMVKTGELVFAPRVNDHPISKSHMESLEKYNMGAYVSAPLRGSGGEVIGLMQLVSRKEKILTELDHHFFEIVSGMFSTVLESKRADEALRQSEVRFRSTFESIPQPSFLWELDKTGEVVLSMVNQATIEMSEGTVFDVVGKPYRELFKSNPELMKIILKTLRTGEASQSEHEFVIPHSKDKRWVLWNATRPDENMVLLIATDITKHRQLEQLLSRQKEELSEFAHVMSHDLQGTLHNALVYTELLEDSFEKEYVSGLREMIDSTQAILKRSVILADAGLIIGEKESVDLNTLFDDVAKREIGKVASFERDDLPTIHCDRLKMIQIVTNLLRNAIEHGKPTLVESRINTTALAYIISIRNNGTPIPKEIREVLLDRTFTTKDVGGLGLMIVRKLVEGHGWTIELNEDPITTFSIHIPREEN
jgi:PAS domain S-box-containing protein